MFVIKNGIDVTVLIDTEIEDTSKLIQFLTNQFDKSSNGCLKSFVGCNKRPFLVTVSGDSIGRVLVEFEGDCTFELEPYVPATMESPAEGGYVYDYVCEDDFVQLIETLLLKFHACECDNANVTIVDADIPSETEMLEFIDSLHLRYYSR